MLLTNVAGGTHTCSKRLTRVGCASVVQDNSDSLITRALYELNKVAGDQSKSLYDINKYVVGFVDDITNYPTLLFLHLKMWVCSTPHGI